MLFIPIVFCPVSAGYAFERDNTLSCRGQGWDNGWI